MQRHSVVLLCVLSAAATSPAAVHSAAPPPADAIPPYSAALDARLQAPPEPFVAIYRAGESVLAFVAAKHVFTERNATLEAIDHAFRTVDPGLVVLEGFPTAMGTSPAPLVDTARRRGTPEADDFANGEAMYAATVALSRGVHFLGGEPTRKELARALIQQGYTAHDVLFVQLVGVLKQSLRAGSLDGVADPGLETTYESWSRDLARDFGLEPLPFETFRARYRETFGIELERDSRLAERPDGGAPDDPTSRLQQDAGVTRDRHLLATIADAVARHERVIVVYGSNHWITLAEALERRYGGPTIQRF